MLPRTRSGLTSAVGPDQRFAAMLQTTAGRSHNLVARAGCDQQRERGEDVAQGERGALDEILEQHVAGGG